MLSSKRVQFASVAALLAPLFAIAGAACALALARVATASFGSFHVAELRVVGPLALQLAFVGALAALAVQFATIAALLALLFAIAGAA